MFNVKYEAIGIIHTPYQDRASTPIQGCFNPEVSGTVEVFPQYAGGLTEISGFSHLILIYCFHLSDGYSLMPRPFLDNKDRGIFATRYCDRPNSIGLSIVRLEKVEENILTIREVDMVDGTPLLDIKPYVPDFDIRENVCRGWYEQASKIEIYKERKGIPLGQ